MHRTLGRTAGWGLLHFLHCPPEGSRVIPQPRVSPRASDLPRPSRVGPSPVSQFTVLLAPRHWTPSPPPTSQEWAHFTPLGTTIPSGLQCVSLEAVAPLDPQGERRRIPLTRHYSRPLSSPSVLFWSLPVGIEHNLLTAFENPGKTLNVTVVSDSATPWSVARQAHLSVGFSRQEYWSGLLCPPPGNLPHPGIEPWSPALQMDSLPAEPPGKPPMLQREIISWFADPRVSVLC